MLLVEVESTCQQWLTMIVRRLQFRKPSLNMSVLKLKLDKASELFQTHQFKEALVAYEDALSFCYRTREGQGLIFNITTTKAALLSILGDQEKAMGALNEVLRADPNHYLALIRRSQVYKKKGKFNRALKDLEMVSTFCPDNLQLTAMRIQIQTLKSKSKAGSSSEESESEEDEEAELNFSNLKKIDRKSCSIVFDKRKSRVTISGDTAFEYEREDECQKSNNSTSVSKENNKEKYLKTFREIETENDTPAPASTIVAKPNNRSKSILKNKNSIMINVPTNTANTPQAINSDSYGGRDSRFVDKIKNIDGKVITSIKSFESTSEKGIRQVQFRKSVFASQEREFKAVEVTDPKQPKKKQGSRKSCLKRSSFDKVQVKDQLNPVRKSKFQTLGRNSIDGIVIKNRKSIDKFKQLENDKVDKPNTGDDSDEGSSYNIFGSNQNVVISKEMKEKLGLDKEEKKEKAPPKGRSNGGKSILKKGSILLAETSEKAGKSMDIKDASEQKAKKPKKSVMFTKSRFAD